MFGRKTRRLCIPKSIEPCQPLVDDALTPADTTSVARLVLQTRQREHRWGSRSTKDRIDKPDTKPARNDLDQDVSTKTPIAAQIPRRA